MPLRLRRPLILTLFLMHAVAMMAALPPSGNPRCPPPPDGGTFTCRAVCKPFSHGSYCESNVTPPPPETSYCYQVRYIGAEVTTYTCHDGAYDQCCDVNARF